MLGAVLLTAHGLLSGVLKVPELALEESEAGELAKALDAVNSFYRVEVAEKTLAWINLSMVAGTIYGTRLIAIRERRVAARAERRANAPIRPTPQAAPTMAERGTDPEIEPEMPLAEGLSLDDIGKPPEYFVGTPGFGAPPFQN